VFNIFPFLIKKTDRQLFKRFREKKVTGNSRPFRRAERLNNMNIKRVSCWGEQSLKVQRQRFNIEWIKIIQLKRNCYNIK